MKYCLTLLILLYAADVSSAVEIRPRIIYPPHECHTCCDRPGNWHRQWAVYHPAKLAGEGLVLEVPLPDTWVVKREKHCCERAFYDTYRVVDPDRTVYEGTFDHYRVRADSPRIPPVLIDYWPDRQFPEWFTEGDYFYFVRIDPADPEQQCSWWISADGQQWDLLEAGALVADPSRRDAVGGPPQLPLPWTIPAR